MITDPLPVHSAFFDPLYACWLLFFVLQAWRSRTAVLLLCYKEMQIKSLLKKEESLVLAVVVLAVSKVLSLNKFFILELSIIYALTFFSFLRGCK